MLRHPVGVGVEEGPRLGLWTGPLLPEEGRLARIHGRGATTRDEEDEFRYRVPLLDWGLMLTDGFKKGRFVGAMSIFEPRREGSPNLIQGEALGESVRGPDVGRDLCGRSRWASLVGETNYRGSEPVEGSASADVEERDTIEFQQGRQRTRGHTVTGGGGGVVRLPPAKFIRHGHETQLMSKVKI